MAGIKLWKCWLYEPDTLIFIGVEQLLIMQYRMNPVKENIIDC